MGIMGVMAWLLGEVQLARTLIYCLPISWDQRLPPGLQVHWPYGGGFTPPLLIARPVSLVSGPEQRCHFPPPMSPPLPGMDIRTHSIVPLSDLAGQGWWYLEHQHNVLHRPLLRKEGHSSLQRFMGGWGEV